MNATLIQPKPKWYPWPLDDLKLIVQNERDLHDHAVFGDLTIFYRDLLILNPGRLYVVQRVVGSAYPFLNGILKALWGRGGNFDDFGN